MRDAVRAHTPAVAGFVVMLLTALTLGSTIQAALPTPAPPIVALPGEPIRLPSPAEDQDLDSYADGVDLWAGDLVVRLDVTHLRFDGSQPYIAVGTDDDQWRLGNELRWPHVVDVDPLGPRVGSASWQDMAIRTGAWWLSIPAEGASKAIAGTSRLDATDALPGVTWPQAFHVNVRDDTPIVTIRLELYDAAPDPDRFVSLSLIEVDVVNALYRVDGDWYPIGQPMTSGGLTFTAELVSDLDQATKQALADRWAPTVRFAGNERFFPLPGETLQQFHGFATVKGDWRTWTREFNNGRAPYMLFLADFNGDRVTDHRDAAIMIDLLRAGGLGERTVYAHVHNTTGDKVVIQYWFLYAYNFVEDERGDDIELLAHNGDREFIQLSFDSLADAQTGWPTHVSYSQHYRGIRIPVEPGDLPFRGTHPDVYVARGSHASYPVAGDDRKFRPAFAGFGDVFDGAGEVWAPGNYTVQLTGNHDWHEGYLWGPMTRHSRDLGTATKPLLQHTFRYPYLDPLPWQVRLNEIPPDELIDAYGGQ